MKTFIHFIKYNNAAILVIVAVFAIGASAFASETGRDLLGGEKRSVQGVDNSLLLAADLEDFDMNFRLEDIQADDEYYYVKYSFMDIDLSDSVWQYQLKEKNRKISIKLDEDLGAYMAKELKQEYSARISILRTEQEKERERGVEKRKEVIEYDGLIGKTLDVVGAVFENYEPIKVKELPSPEPDEKYAVNESENSNAGQDDLAQVYNDYVNSHSAEISALDQNSGTEDASAADIASGSDETITTEDPQTEAETTAEQENETAPIISSGTVEIIEN